MKRQSNAVEAERPVAAVKESKAVNINKARDFKTLNDLHSGTVQNGRMRQAVAMAIRDRKMSGENLRLWETETLAKAQESIKDLKLLEAEKVAIRNTIRTIQHAYRQLTKAAKKPRTLKLNDDKTAYVEDAVGHDRGNRGKGEKGEGEETGGDANKMQMGKVPDFKTVCDWLIQHAKQSNPGVIAECRELLQPVAKAYGIIK